MPDDYTSDTQTTGAVAVGAWVDAKLENVNDVDWFAVDLVAGKTYSFVQAPNYTLDFKPDVGYLPDPEIQGIYDAAGNPVPTEIHQDWRNNSTSSRVYFRPDADGKYFIGAGGVDSGHGYANGGYKVFVKEVPDDFGDFHFHAGAGSIEVGTPVAAMIDYGADTDWFAVELQVGDTYRFDLRGKSTGHGTLKYPVIGGLYDDAGVRISPSVDEGGTGRNARFLFVAPDSGTYYVSAASDWLLKSGVKGSYELSVVNVTDDFEAGNGTSGAVSVGGSVTGEIETEGDHDWFEVNLVAEHTYRFDLGGKWTSAGTLRNPYLHGIHRSDGSLVPGTSDDNSGSKRDARVEFTPDEDGAYYVDAGSKMVNPWRPFGAPAFDPLDTYDGTYTLSVLDVTSGPPDEAGQTPGTASHVDVDSTPLDSDSVAAVGEIGFFQDRDWFEVSLQAGREYRVDLEGSPTGNGTLRNPHVYGIYNSGGSLLPGTEDANSGLRNNAQVTFTPRSGGAYFISVGGAGDREGTYRLSVFDTTDGAPDGAVAVGGSARGEVETRGERDWFRVDLDMGKTYEIDLEGSVTWAGTLRDPYLYGVYDENGDRYSGTTDDDDGVGYNSRVTFTAPTDGAYYVVAGAYGGLTGSYTLSVEEVM